MGSRTKKERERQKIYDIQEQLFYENRIKLLATNQFEWEGLDELNIPEWYVENNLYEKGKLAFVKDSTKGILCLPYNNTGTKTIYGETTKVTVYGTNYTKTFNRNEVVLLRNNKLELPTYDLVNIFIRKLQEVSRIIDTNIYLQKISKILLMDSNAQLTIENLMAQYEGNVPFILTDKNIKRVLEGTGIDVIDTSVEFKALDLMDAKNRYWRELMETVGINSANTEKKERLVTDEVNSNNELNRFSNDVFLSTREQACKELYDMWGINLNVKRRVEDGYSDMVTENVD